MNDAFLFIDVLTCGVCEWFKNTMKEEKPSNFKNRNLFKIIEKKILEKL